jgi:dolichol kinase
MNWPVIIFVTLSLYISIILAFIASTKFEEKWIPRKIIHIIGLSTAVIAVVFLSFIELLTVSILFVLSFLILTIIPQISLYQKLLVIAVREEETKIEGILNSVLTLLNAFILYVLFMYLDLVYLFVAAMLSLIVGDGLAELVGRNYPIVKYKIFTNKSISGSLTVFFGSFISLIVVFAIMIPSIYLSIWIIILASLLAMIVEAISISFIDNITIPVIVALTLYLGIGI